MVLVVGATGLLGSAVCQRLLERGKKVRALVRPTSSEQKVRALRSSSQLNARRPRRIRGGSAPLAGACWIPSFRLPPRRCRGRRETRLTRWMQPDS